MLRDPLSLSEAIVEAREAFQILPREHLAYLVPYVN